MDADFPAAHSMDTGWFAVDRDGHVALFESGEAGAVPTEAFAGDEAFSVREQWCQFIPAGSATYDVRGRIPPGVGPESNPNRALVGAPVVLVLSSLEPVRDVLAAGQAVEVPVSENYAVLFRDISEEQLQGYRALPEYRACWNQFFGDDEGYRSSFSLASHGLFVYQHLTDNWISGPYGREVIPGQPVHIDQLPADLRQAIGLFRFDKLSFSETLRLQPVELVECISWESAYMDVTGHHIRPIPGKEAEFAEAHGELSDLAGEYEIQPPTDNPE